jgi:hypothetical protein
MHPLTRAVLLAAWAVGSAPNANAQEVYSWTDAEGTTHFTDNPAAVPKGVRAAPVAGVGVSVVPGAPRPPPPAPAEAAPDAGVVRIRRERKDPAAEERGWREAFRAAHERVRQLEEAVAAGVREVEEINGLPVRGRVQCANMGGGCMGFSDPRWEQQRQQLERNRAELREARGALDELERRASAQSVPREWRR